MKVRIDTSNSKALVTESQLFEQRTGGPPKAAEEYLSSLKREGVMLLEGRVGEGERAVLGQVHSDDGRLCLSRGSDAGGSENEGSIFSNKQKDGCILNLDVGMQVGASTIILIYLIKRLSCVAK